MKKTICFLLAALLVFCMSIPVFAAEEEEKYPLDTEYYSKFKGQNIKLNVYNWGEYIADGADGFRDVIAWFEELTGIDVVYTTFDTNEGLYSKLKSGGAYYDVVIPSDYMISRFISQGMLEKLNFDNIPNFEKYVDDAYKNKEYDENQEYSVPYTWGTVGIIYNTKYVDRVDSWDALFDERYKGKILMFNNSRDTFAIALKKLGYSMNSEDPDELVEAATLLKDQKPLVQARVMDQVFDKMIEENAWIAPYYAGDFLTMHDANPDLAFCFPKEGTNFFLDAMCIPKGCVNKEAAEMFINFMCEPQVSAENCGMIGYSTPITAARDLMDPEMAQNEVAYPAREIIDNTEVFINLSDDANRQLDILWISVCSGGLTGGFWIVTVSAVVLLAFFGIRSSVIRKKRKKIREET